MTEGREASLWQCRCGYACLGKICGHCATTREAAGRRTTPRPGPHRAVQRANRRAALAELRVAVLAWIVVCALTVAFTVWFHSL